LAKAKADAEAIAKIDADGFGTNLLMGSIARVERKLPEAEHYFELAHLKSPGNFAATNSLALVLAEQPEEAKHRAALEFASINAEKYAQNPEAWSTLAWVFFRLERYSDAERAMERALSARTLHPDSAFYLGTMLERRGKLEDAQAVLEKALETPEAFAYRTEVTELLAKLKKQIKSAQDLEDEDLEKTPTATKTPPATEKPAPKTPPKTKR
jgi:tetratricopeptide (TPR) repeat protein